MFFRLDSNNGQPIYEQVLRQIKFAVACEALRPHDLAPSVREVSKSLLINPNTVTRAYRQLQQEGILATVRGTGLAVTEQAPKQCRADRQQLVRQTIRSALAEAFQSGLASEEIRKVTDEELAALKPKGTRASEPR